MMSHRIHVIIDVTLGAMGGGGQPPSVLGAELMRGK